MADPQDYTDRLNDFAEGLRAMGEQVEAEAIELEGKARLKRDEFNRIQKAVRDLVGPDEKAKKNTKRTKPRQSTLDKIEDVVKHFSTEGATHNMIVVNSGLSHDTVTRGLQVLRDTDKVRRAGVNSDRAHVYKPYDEVSVNA